MSQNSSSTHTQKNISKIPNCSSNLAKPYIERLADLWLSSNIYSLMAFTKWFIYLVCAEVTSWLACLRSYSSESKELSPSLTRLSSFCGNCGFSHREIGSPGFSLKTLSLPCQFFWRKEKTTDNFGPTQSCKVAKVSGLGKRLLTSSLC